MAHRKCVFLEYCEGLVINLHCFSLLSYILGFREKRAEHTSFLAFETNFRTSLFRVAANFMIKHFIVPYFIPMSGKTRNI